MLLKDFVGFSDFPGDGTEKGGPVAFFFIFLLQFFVLSA
jgi:hypothetical protein